VSLRRPQDHAAALRVESGASVLDAELMAERASSLGRSGREVERALAGLEAAAPGSPARPGLLRAAAAAVWSYFVQREACGLVDHTQAVELYRIPGAVLARLGAVE
jgi:hypothetical protein